MSKKIVIVFLTMLLLFVTSCGNTKTLPTEITCEQILNAAKKASEQSENTTEYIKGQKEFDAYTMSLWCDGNYTECSEYKLLADYAVFYSSDNTTYEIAVLKAKSNDGAEDIAKVLTRRQKTLAAGAKAAYDPNFNKLMKDSKIIIEGQFVILLITPDNDTVITAIQNLKR